MAQNTAKIRGMFLQSDSSKENRYKFKNLKRMVVSTYLN